MTRRLQRLIFAAVGLVLSWSSVRVASAQPQSPSTSEAQGVLPDAAFRLDFQKCEPSDADFGPFYSWDGHIGLHATAYRRGASAFDVTAIVQTVGTESLRSRISVGANGYILGFGYSRPIGPVMMLVDFRHLSSHLTRDLSDKEDEVRSRGGNVPAVGDAADYNVIRIGVSGMLSRWPFEPDVLVLVTPINFRFNGGRLGDVRPLYVETSWKLWRGRYIGLLAETRHEVGSNLLDSYSLATDLLQGDPRRQLQVFISLAPGNQLHVSPTVGAVIDGLSFGARVDFHM